MKLTHKTLGLSILALAAGLFASATLAETHGRMGGMMDGEGMGPRAMMQEADADKDGKITKDEFETWRAAQFVDADTDKDGKLSVDELVSARMKQAESRMRAMAERMVSEQDADKDGKLSVSELAALPMPGFERMDSNGDGVLDASDMQRMGHGRMGGHHHGRMGGQGMDGQMMDGQGMDGQGMDQQGN